MVVAPAVDREGRVRRIDLHPVAGRDLPHVERRVARRHTKLHEVRLIVVQAELRAVAGSNEGARPDLELGVAVGTRIQNVAGRQRRVGLGLGPLLCARTPEGHFAVEIAHSCRRDVAGLLRGRRVGGRDRARAAHRDRQNETRYDDTSTLHVDSLGGLRFETRQSGRMFTSNVYNVAR